MKHSNVEQGSLSQVSYNRDIFRMNAADCEICLQRRHPQLLVLIARGKVPESCGEPLFAKLRSLCHGKSNVRLFMDLGRTRQMPASVNHWTAFFKEHRETFGCVYLWVPDYENHLAAAILQHLSGMNDRFKIIRAKSIFNAFLKLAAEKI